MTVEKIKAAVKLRVEGVLAQAEDFMASVFVDTPTREYLDEVAQRAALRPPGNGLVPALHFGNYHMWDAVHASAPVPSERYVRPLPLPEPWPFEDRPES